MFSWKQLEAQLRQIINTAIRFVKARRNEEASITFGAFLIWAGIYFPEWLEKAGVKEFVASLQAELVVTSAAFPKAGTPRPTNAHSTLSNAWPA